MMRWSIIRLIWMRDLRDQLRDRRTLFMIAGLPLLLYPVLGAAVLGFALGFSERNSIVAVVRPAGLPKEFPPRDPPTAGRSAVPVAARLSAIPLSGALPSSIGAYGLAWASRLQFDYPALVAGGQFTVLEAHVPPRQPKDPASQSRLDILFLDQYDRAVLDERKCDLILTAPPDFYARLEEAEEPGNAAHKPVAIEIKGRPNDEHSRQARQRLDELLRTWQHDLKRVRLARRGLPDQYDEPVRFVEPGAGNAGGDAVTLFDLMGKLFPFMLGLWSLAGALYPAVDLCAGEKERGTMETLLITPAGREEIVTGKFLTIWIFSAGTALINLLSMGITTAFFINRLPQPAMPVGALFWCVLLSLPQAAVFSAVSLAIGAYARSSKEGQYYLMPLFLVTMPLIFLTLAPGVELNAFYALVPVTGVALLMQRLMLATSLEQVPWLYFIPVLAPIALYSWLALRWAIEQFQREEVLFREAERWDWKLWLRRLFREKEPLPNTGQALFCFGLILALRWLSLGLGRQLPPEVHAVIVALAFVAAPPSFMALLLNTLPRVALSLRWPTWRDLGLAALLALLLLPPLAVLAQAAYLWFPQQLNDPHPLAQILRMLHEPQDDTAATFVLAFLAYALAPAVCEEIAFRGFILTGLYRRFRPRNAVLLSAFLYALYHLNVFLFLPAFALGIVLGLLTARSRSLVPAVLFHFLHNTLLLAWTWLPQEEPSSLLGPPWSWIAGLCLAAALVLLWWLYRKPYIALARRREKWQ